VVSWNPPAHLQVLYDVDSRKLIPRRGAVSAVLALVGAATAVVLLVLVVPAVVVPLTSVGAVPAPATVRGTRALPAVEDCGIGKPEVKPGMLTIACADANSLGEHLVWSKWAASGAAATGSYTWNTCVPYCAASKKWDKTTANFTLAKPVDTAVGWLFEELTVRVTGKVPAKFMKVVTISEKPVTTSTN